VQWFVWCQALRPIKSEEELTISYVNAEANEQERAVALRNYLFRCECDKCVADRQLTVSYGQDNRPLSPLEKPRPMDLTAQDLTIPLATVEPGGCLSSETIDRAATLLTTAVKAQIVPALRCAFANAV
jgi:hypothetical protein